jgi:hypothetical protein
MNGNTRPTKVSCCECGKGMPRKSFNSAPVDPKNVVCRDCKSKVRVRNK